MGECAFHTLVQTVYTCSLSSLRPPDVLYQFRYLSNTILVRSPPSSRIIFKGRSTPPKGSVCSIPVSFFQCLSFQANTPLPTAAIATAACDPIIEKMCRAPFCYLGLPVFQSTRRSEWSCADNRLHVHKRLKRAVFST